MLCNVRYIVLSFSNDYPKNKQFSLAFLENIFVPKTYVLVILKQESLIDDTTNTISINLCNNLNKTKNWNMQHL